MSIFYNCLGTMFLVLMAYTIFQGTWWQFIITAFFGLLFIVAGFCYVGVEK